MTEQFWIIALQILSYSSLGIMTAILVIFIRNGLWQTDELYFLFLYLLVSLVISIASFVMHSFQENNLPLLHLLTLLEVILLSLYYQRLFELRKNKWFYAFIGFIAAFNTYSKTLGQVVLVGFSIGYIFKRLGSVESSFKQTFFNQVNSAIMLYFCGSLFIFMTGSMFDNSTNFPLMVWVLNSILYLIFVVLILISTWNLASHLRKSSNI